MTDDHAVAYDQALTDLCEQALVTLIAGAGFWGRHLYLVGGLVPRYLVPEVEGMPLHVGSRDVDLAISLVVDDGGPEYETLLRNLEDHDFHQTDVSFRWTRTIGRQSVIVEFLGEDPDVEPGKAFKPRDGTGKDFQALNVPGVRLLPRDHRIVAVEANRLDGGGRCPSSSSRSWPTPTGTSGKTCMTSSTCSRPGRVGPARLDARSPEARSAVNR